MSLGVSRVVAIILPADDIDEAIGRMYHKIFQELELFTRDGSRWVFDEILILKIHHVAYQPLAGSVNIRLPDFTA